MGKKSRVRSNKEQPKNVKKDQPKSAPTSQALRPWALGLILGGAFLAFTNGVITNGFAYDDQTQILQNEVIRSFGNLPTAFTKEVWFWRVLQDKDPNKEIGPTTPYYRPVFTIYLMIGWHLFHSWASGWHLTNLLLHLCCVYFVFLIIEKLTGDLRLTCIATLLFAVHPLRVESVTWISGVTDLIAALFILPSFYRYVLYREGGKTKDLIASIGLFLLAAFSKEAAIVYPFVIAAYEIFVIPAEQPLRARVKSAAAYAGSYLLVSAVYFAMRYYALGFVLNDARYQSYPVSSIVLTIPLVIWKYIGLLVLPINLTLFHATPAVTSPLSPRFWLPTLGLVVLTAAAWRLRQNRIARFALLWFAINLLPVLNLGAFSPDFMVQERYVYIPSIGFSLLVAMGLLKIPVEQWLAIGGRRTAQAALVGLIVILFVGKTFAQNSVWKDDITLWEYGAEAAPEAQMAHYILGHKYLDRQQFEPAVREFEQYMQIRDNNPVVISNLAAGHLWVYESEVVRNKNQADRSHVDRAIALCQKGLELDGENPLLWDTLGHAYTYNTELRNYQRAIFFFQRGLDLQPENAMINFHLGATYFNESQLDNALRYLEIARQQQSNFPDIYKFLAYAYEGKGQSAEAIANFNRYLELQPNGFDSVAVRQHLDKLRSQPPNTGPRT